MYICIFQAPDILVFIIDGLLSFKERLLKKRSAFTNQKASYFYLFPTIRHGAYQTAQHILEEFTHLKVKEMKKKDPQKSTEE